MEEVKQKLREICEEGYVPSLRKGATGIGYTLETKLGIEENNISDSDIDGVCELKTRRSGGSSRITAFCVSPVWAVKPRKLVEKFGYQCDKNQDRTNLYAPLKFGVNNPPSGRWNFLVDVEPIEEEKCLVIRDSENQLIGHLPLSVLRYKFRTKYHNLLLVKAKTRKKKGSEQFWYNEAYYAEGITIKKVEELLRNGSMVVELRLWLDRKTQKFKDHGTCFRVAEKGTLSLYETVETLFNIGGQENEREI
jgi:hypothetical protein